MRSVSLFASLPMCSDILVLQETILNNFALRKYRFVEASGSLVFRAAVRKMCFFVTERPSHVGYSTARRTCNRTLSSRHVATSLVHTFSPDQNLIRPHPLSVLVLFEYDCTCWFLMFRRCQNRHTCQFSGVFEELAAPSVLSVIGDHSNIPGLNALRYFLCDSFGSEGHRAHQRIDHELCQTGPLMLQVFLFDGLPGMMDIDQFLPLLNVRKEISVQVKCRRHAVR